MNVKQSHFLSWAGLSLLLMALSACTLVPLRSLWALRGFELQQLDAAQLRALVYLPAEVGAPREALRVKVRAERGVGGEVRDWVLALVPVSGPLAAHTLPTPRPGGHWVALGLPPAEQQKLQALRQQLQAWKAGDPPEAKRRVQMSVEPQLCRRGAAPLAAGEVRVDAWVRWQAGQDDLRLLDGATGRDIDEQLADQPLPACG